MKIIPIGEAIVLPIVCVRESVEPVPEHSSFRRPPRITVRIGDRFEFDQELKCYASPKTHLLRNFDRSVFVYDITYSEFCKLFVTETVTKDLTKYSVPNYESYLEYVKAISYP